jgi:hypothetical protein
MGKYKKRPKKLIKILKNNNVLVFDSTKAAAIALNTTTNALATAKFRGGALRCGSIVLTDSKNFKSYQSWE